MAFPKSLEEKMEKGKFKEICDEELNPRIETIAKEIDRQGFCDLTLKSISFSIS